MARYIILKVITLLLLEHALEHLRLRLIIVHGLVILQVMQILLVIQLQLTSHVGAGLNLVFNLVLVLTSRQVLLHGQTNRSQHISTIQ